MHYACNYIILGYITVIIINTNTIIIIIITRSITTTNTTRQVPEAWLRQAGGLAAWSVRYRSLPDAGFYNSSSSSSSSSSSIEYW